MTAGTPVTSIAMVSGAAGLAGLGIYMEFGAWVGLVGAAIALLVWRIRKRAAPDSEMRAGPGIRASRRFAGTGGRVPNGHDEATITT